MRLMILSDLHREIWYREQTHHEVQVDHFPTIDLAVSRPDVVVLAGDIDTGDRAIAWARTEFETLPVLYIHGNHEAYGNDLEEMQREIGAACARSSNVQYLHRKELIIDGVRFLGATLWTDFRLYGDERYKEASIEAGARMNDYRSIRFSSGTGRYLTPLDTEALHLADVAWLEAALARPYAGKTVVVTHMAPSRLSISETFRGMELSAAFASNLDHLVEKVDVWVHGHTHSSADYRIGRGRVICNPLGYPSRRTGLPENAKFSPNLIVEI